MTIRWETTAGKVVLKNGVETWQAYNTWGGYDLYKGPERGLMRTVRWWSAWTGRTTITARRCS